MKEEQQQQSKEHIKAKMARLGCCILIPTYNNAKTLAQVLEGVLQYSPDVLVVNDGSTDSTNTILRNYPQVQTLSLPKNRGKGNALRMGFDQARQKGFRFALTIDSDGQHFPEDIPIFVAALEQSPEQDILLIGSRNMGQDGIPKKSSFGNRFSNFWFWVETGTKLQDTQSGFRLYPIAAMENIKLYTNKFEFEIEAIVKSAWQGIPVRNIPIQVHYDREDRISHFRPFTDFARISVLNTWLVTVAFLYIKPRNLYRKIKQKGLKQFLLDDVLGHNDPPHTKALSVALGVGIGLSPFWGFHTALVLSLALLFKLNKAIAFGFSNVSLPPFIPFIVYFSLVLGKWVLGEPLDFSFDSVTHFEGLGQNLFSYILGSCILALIGATLSGAIAYFSIRFYQRKNN